MRLFESSGSCNGPPQELDRSPEDLLNEKLFDIAVPAQTLAATECPRYQSASAFVTSGYRS